MYHDRGTEKQVVRTIRLKSTDLEAVTHLLEQLLDQSGSGESGGDCADTPSAERLLRLARDMLRVRRLREDWFKKPMFGEPAWDMLLTLYVNSADGARQSVGRLTAASGSPATTALRWLDYLEKEQFVVREPNPTDRRSDFVGLTDKGFSAMEQYLSETLRSLA